MCEKKIKTRLWGKNVNNNVHVKKGSNTNIEEIPLVCVIFGHICQPYPHPNIIINKD